MEGPANTLSYMIAGFVVVFGMILAYLVSLVVRHRNLRQEEKMLEELEQEKH